MGENNIEELRNQINSARREIARILYRGNYGNDNWEQDYEARLQEDSGFRIENEYEHNVGYQLDDFEVDRVQELRKQITDLLPKLESAEKEQEEKKSEEKKEKSETSKPEEEVSEELDVEAYREKMAKESAVNIRMNEIRIRMMQIRSILEDPNSELTDAEKMQLETERYNLQNEFENLAGIQHGNPSGPNLSGTKISISEEERQENEAIRALKIKLAERDKRLNEIRIEMMRIKADLDRKGIKGQTPELKALQEEFEKLSSMTIEEIKAETEIGKKTGKKGETQETKTETEQDPSKKTESEPSQKAEVEPAKVENEQAIAEKQEKLDKIKKEIEIASAELEELKKKSDISKEEIDKLKAEIDSLTAQRDALKAEIAELEAKKAELEGGEKTTPTATGKEGKEGETGPTAAVGAAATGATTEGEEKQEEEKEGEENNGNSGKAPTKSAGSEDNSLTVQGFWANMLINMIRLLRKLTGKEDLGAKLEQSIYARSAAKVLGPELKANEKRIKEMAKEAAREAREGRAEEQHEEQREEEQREEEQEEQQTKKKPTATKKKGFFSRLFAKEEEEEFIIPRGKVRTGEEVEGEKIEGEEVESDPVGAAAKTKLVPEKELPPLTAAEQDFLWMYAAIKNKESRDPNLTAIVTDELDKIKGISDEELQEMVENGEISVYGDEISARASLVITKSIERVHELAKELGVSTEDKNGPRLLDDLFPELSSRLDTRRSMQEMEAEEAKKARETQGKSEPTNEDQELGD